MKCSTFRLVAPGFSCECTKYTRLGCGGHHWCGCVPSKDALLVVANRVWPLYARTNSLFGRDAPSCASHFLRVSSDNVVRFPLTTRVRIPFNCGGALTPSGDLAPPGPDA